MVITLGLYWGWLFICGFKFIWFDLMICLLDVLFWVRLFWVWGLIAGSGFECYLCVILFVCSYDCSFVITFYLLYDDGW